MQKGNKFTNEIPPVVEWEFTKDETIKQLTAKLDELQKENNSYATIIIGSDHAIDDLKAKLEATDKRLDWQLTQCFELNEKLNEAKGLIDEMDKYLDYNKHTTICNGSIFHEQMKKFIKDYSKVEK